MSRPLRVAAAQYEPRVGELEHNRGEAVRWTEAAAAEGARLVVLPELASSGYVFESEAEAEALAERPRGLLVEALTDVCARHSLWVCTGINERAGDCRYNSAVLIGPQGLVATYRKLHLFYDEQSWFQPGTQLPVVELPFGRVGMMICFDVWFPEVARALALGGAEIICVPTNWVSSFKPTVYDDRGYCQGDYMTMAAAAANGCVVVAADRIGTERNVRFLGADDDRGADGWPVAGPASRDREQLLVADIDLESVERARARTPRNHLLGDRRPETYNPVAVEVSQPGPAPAGS
jgi:predicted amidohydrolase